MIEGLRDFRYQNHSNSGSMIHIGLAGCLPSAVGGPSKGGVDAPLKNVAELRSVEAPT